MFAILNPIFAHHVSHSPLSAVFGDFAVPSRHVDVEFIESCHAGGSGRSERRVGGRVPGVALWKESAGPGRRCVDGGCMFVTCFWGGLKGNPTMNRRLFGPAYINTYPSIGFSRMARVCFWLHFKYQPCSFPYQESGYSKEDSLIGHRSPIFSVPTHYRETMRRKASICLKGKALLGCLRSRCILRGSQNETVWRMS